jgi:hypothetical protein
MLNRKIDLTNVMALLLNALRLERAVVHLSA